MAVKTKRCYVCQQCGAQAPKWAGQCSDCGNWNTLVEEELPATAKTKVGYAGEKTDSVWLDDIDTSDVERQSTGLTELDRALGGGLVAGSVVLIGGDPGIGKSTLLLQALSFLSQHQRILYITGEESLQQVGLRAKRLSLQTDQLRILTDTNVETIIAQAKKEKPQTLVVDSVQTIFTHHMLINSAII